MPHFSGLLIPRTLGVVGAGQMGAGIAQVAAIAGLQVTLADLSQTALDRGLNSIHTSLARQVRKETLSQEAANLAMQRISTAGSLQVRLYRHVTAQMWCKCKLSKGWLEGP